jgi:hypothetical protein
MIYPLEQIVDDRNRAIYQDVSSAVTIEFHDQDAKEEQEGWGAQYFPDKAVAAVLCAPTRFPQASFAHELLHIKYELNGYQRPKFVMIETTPDQQQSYRDWAGGFMGWAYNQLMHLRMLSSFTAMGFPREQFLKEDAGRLDRISSYIKKLKGGKAKKRFDHEVFARVYLQLRNPSSNQRMVERLRNELKQVSSRQFAAMEDFTNRWIAAASPDVAWYLARLFNICQHPNVGVGNEPEPENMTWARDCPVNR